MTTDNAKIALVTGASRGLGRNMAIALARKGVDVIGAYHTNKAEADATAAAIAASRSARLRPCSIKARAVAR